MVTVLRATDTHRTFTTEWLGRHNAAVHGITGGKTVTIQWEDAANDPGTWHNVDTTGASDATWTSDGIGSLELVPGRRHRVLASAAGPVLILTPVTNQIMAGAPVSPKIHLDV